MAVEKSVTFVVENDKETTAYQRYVNTPAAKNQMPKDDKTNGSVYLDKKAKLDDDNGLLYVTVSATPPKGFKFDREKYESDKAED